jgi:transposase
MQAQEGLFVGVDVAKKELVVCEGVGGTPRTILNEADAIDCWLQSLPQGASIAMESTGRYHQRLATMASHAGFKVYVLNARDVHFYAKALGSRAKTDRVDALIIVRYLVEHQARLHVWSMADPADQRMSMLLARRTQVARQASAVGQVLKDGLSSLAEATALRAAFKALLERLDAEIAAAVQADPVRAEGYRNLQTIPGIGEVIGGMLAALFSRIQFANADAVVAYSGLDPRANDSGSKKGRRRLSKRGPSQLRRNIYLAGLSARTSKVAKPVYEALLAKGLTKTECVVILGRKLLRIAFSIWRSGKPFDPTLMVGANA